MNTVIFKTENAQFKFDRKDVEKCLEIMASEYENGVDETDKILKRISIFSYGPKFIQLKHNYLGHIVLDLIGVGKGSVTCELCGKLYEVQKLKSIAIGAGKNPFSITTGKKGGIKSLFGKRKNPSKFGGKGFTCPVGHIIISMETWKT